MRDGIVKSQLRGKSVSPMKESELCSTALAACLPERTADSLQPGVLSPFLIQSPVITRLPIPVRASINPKDSVNCSRHKRSSRPKGLCQSLCQRPPIRPVLPVLPSSNCFIMNNLTFYGFHGMEEVVGSIPTRSTKYINNLKAPPFSDFVAFLSQIPKSLRELALKLRPLWVQ
jgi:hypothetical protein